MLYSKIYKKISKRIAINEINLINSYSEEEKENYKKEIRRLCKLKIYVLKKLIVLKNYSEEEIENFILWNI